MMLMHFLDEINCTSPKKTCNHLQPFEVFIAFPSFTTQRPTTEKTGQTNPASMVDTSKAVTPRPKDFASDTCQVKRPIGWWKQHGSTSPLFPRVNLCYIICSSMIYQMIREKSGFQLPLFFSAEFVDLFIYDSSYDSREVPEAFCGINAMERASMFLDSFFDVYCSTLSLTKMEKRDPIPSAV